MSYHNIIWLKNNYTTGSQVILQGTAPQGFINVSKFHEQIFIYMTINNDTRSLNGITIMKAINKLNRCPPTNGLLVGQVDYVAQGLHHMVFRFPLVCLINLQLRVSTCTQ